MRTVLFALLLGTAPVAARTPDGGGALDAADLADALPAPQREAIVRQLQRNEASLHQAGLLAAPTAAPTPLQWPLQVQPDYPYAGYFGVSNFVDHDAAFPGHVLDYACGARSYDTAGGYNHAGTDYFLWPAPWRTMDAQQVAVVAAAPGTIVGRSDGNFDRSCAMGGADWNAVYVRHADGGTAWYGHLKNGSVTPKGLGESVASGEFLGFVGSSGSSTAPHLHFELHDAAGQVVDPRHGDCNAAPERWAEPQAYEDPRINSLSLHTEPPVMLGCGTVDGAPVQEDLHDTGVIAPGQAFYVMASFRDQRRGEPSVLRLRRPDGGVQEEWRFDLADGGLPGDFYAATYWYWRHVLPGDAPLGNWRLEAQFLGQDYATAFVVVSSAQQRRNRVEEARAAAARLARAPRR